MLATLSPQFWRIFPLVLGGMFIASGIGLIIFGSIIVNRTSDKDDVLGFAEAGNAAGGNISISVGVVDLITGIICLVAALLNKRWLVFAYAILLALLILGNLFTFFILSINNAEDWRSTTNTLKNLVVELYGNYSQPDGRKFTALVDKMQSDTPCCGFAADEKENVFLKTHWYISINDKSKVPMRTLPDTCCKVRGEECFNTKDLQKARDGGHVHKIDCINEKYKAFGSQMTLAFIEVLMSTLMQVISAIFTVLFLMYGPAGASE